MAGKEHPMKNSGAVVRGIAPVEEEVKADGMSGRLAEEEAVTGGKRKAQESKAGRFSDGGKPGADATDGADSEDEATDADEWMEMPVDYLAWILSKTKEDSYVPPIEDVCDPELPQEEVNRRNQLYRKINERVRVANGEFFRFQAWVRDTLERNGRVMIPADTFDPAPEVQEEIDQIWRDVMNECGVDITKLP